MARKAKINKRAYLEYRDEKSDKFYRVSFYDDGEALITYGRCGTDGSQITYNHAKAVAKLNEKYAKGYRDARDPIPDTDAIIDPFPTRKDTPEQAAAKARVAEKRAVRANAAAWLDELDQIQKAK